MAKIIYSEGAEINGILFLKEVENKSTTRMGNFLCRCGSVFTTRISSIKNGNTTSCGCVHKKNTSNINKTHGLTNTTEYKIWGLMKDRCNNPNSTFYKNYGGRGITVCAEWNKSFQSFLSDMGKRVSNKLTLDRIENDKGYYKENCRWSTKKEQSSNRRNNLIITYNGKTKILKDWAIELNLNYKNTHKRIHNLKWGIEKAFNPALYKSGNGKVLLHAS